MSSLIPDYLSPGALESFVATYLGISLKKAAPEKDGATATGAASSAPPAPAADQHVIRPAVPAPVWGAEFTHPRVYSPELSQFQSLANGPDVYKNFDPIAEAVSPTIGLVGVEGNTRGSTVHDRKPDHSIAVTSLRFEKSSLLFGYMNGTAVVDMHNLTKEHMATKALFSEAHPGATWPGDLDPR